MLQLASPMPVKVFAGLLLAKSADLITTIGEMEALWGDADCVSDPFSFDCTDYYADEMGGEISRVFVSFASLQNPDQLAQLKLDANSIEERFLDGADRVVNIDVGYLDVHKLVLASTKEGPCKIYGGQGIWADMTLRYSKGTFQPFPWTFVDFAQGRYDRVFLKIREIYKKQIRNYRTEAQ